MHIVQEAQLSHRDRATLYVADIFTNQIHVFQSKFNNITFYLLVKDTVKPGPVVSTGLY